MEETDHPLGMTVLEVQDCVSRYSSLDIETIGKLMASDDFRELTPSLQQSVLGQLIPSPSWLTAEVDRCAILVTDRWTVSIHGDSHAHCISALMKYRNAIAAVLDSTVVGEVRAPIAVNTGPLHEQVARRQRRRRFRNYGSKVGWLLVGGIIGMVLGILGDAIVGGLM